MTSKIIDTLAKVPAAGKFPFIAASISILLVIGSVNSGLQFSDYTHRKVLLETDLGNNDHNALSDMFTFTTENPARLKLAMDYGKIPWWTYSRLKVSFFRPLAAATHWLDYKLWPKNPVVMHIHSLVWFGLLIFMAASVYRRLLTPVWMAGLAALLYAIDDAHGIPAGWIANRNALVAAVFGFMSLYFHDRWRRDGWKTGAFLGPGAFGMALFSAEAGLGAGAFLVSYQLFLDSSHLRRRLIAFLPYAGIAIAWYAVYKHLGYGTYGSGAYIDPGKEAAVFFKAMIERIPLLLYGQWFWPEPSIYGVLPKPLAYVLLGAVYILLTGIAILLLPLLRHDKLARFWSAGMILALLPLCATFPNNRLLLFAGLGAMGLLAQFLSGLFANAAWLPAAKTWRRSAWAVAALFIAIHFVAAPLNLPGQSRRMAKLDQEVLTGPVLKLAEKEHIADKIIILINPPIPFVYSHIWDVYQKQGVQPPQRIRIMSSGLTSTIKLTRADANTLEVEPEYGFITQDFDRLYRGSAHPMTIGQRIVMSDVQIEVLSLTEDQRPLRARFTFSHPLEDEILVFYTWQDGDFAPFQPPKTGASVKLARISM